MKEIAIVAFEGISLFHLSVPIAIFKDAIPAQQKLFNIKVCADKTGTLQTADGLNITVAHNTEIIKQAGIVIFPSWQPDNPPSKQLTELINQAADSNKLIVGLCLGAYALAYAGLLDDKRATSHWKYADDFSKKFPKVLFETNPLFIAEHNIITSAGSAAAIDCCLYLVKQYYGVKVANQIARMMVSSPQRSSGQNQYIEQPILERPSDERMAKLIDHILADITNDYRLKDAAAYCSMSIRSFSRHFKSCYGVSFMPWLINARLNVSLELLESTNLPIAQISEQSGFSSEQIFRKHFKLRFDSTPNSWRCSFKK
jgi:transcriptional regulator GlxA family with amidase domain